MVLNAAPLAAELGCYMAEGFAWNATLNAKGKGAYLAESGSRESFSANTTAVEQSVTFPHGHSNPRRCYGASQLSRKVRVDSKSAMAVSHLGN